MRSPGESEEGMSEFLGLLKKFKDGETEFVAGINGKEVTVKVNNINGDMVTLIEADDNKRYDLYYTQIVICSVTRRRSEGQNQ